MTQSLNKDLVQPFKEPERVFRSSRKLLKTTSLDSSSFLELNLITGPKNQFEEEVTETMTEPTMEEYMTKTRDDYGSGVIHPNIDDKVNFEIKGQFLKELRDNTFSRSDHEDSNEHIKKVVEIDDLFHILDINVNQVMLRAFPMSLTGAASRWLRNKPAGLITDWETLKKKFLSKYCPPARTAKKMEEINNFQQDPNETLYNAWEQFKDLLLKCAIPTMKVADAKKAIDDMADYSKKWHDGTSTRKKSTKTSDGLAAIQAQLNNLGREIKKVNKKVYAAQVGCEICKGPHYIKGCLDKEDHKTLKEAYYSQFGVPFPQGQYKAAALGFYQRNNGNPSQPTSKGEDPRSFTLPCIINNMCFNKALADLGASVSVMPFSTYTTLGLGDLAPTKLIVEFADKTMKRPKGLAENMLVVIDKFTFSIDFIVLDMPEDI
ncbi:hypothetical protein Tco_0813413 [Tanacetum coccineum]